MPNELRNQTVEPFGRFMNQRLATLATVLLIGAPSVTAFDLSLAVVAAPTSTTTARQRRPFATPVKGLGIAKAPPAGAQVSQAIRFNTSLQWKTNPSTRTVFAIDAERRLWFIDPTSGWPYTLDARGVVYTANALSGIVYSLGALARWQGSVPYFFANWAFVDGFYTVPALGLYLSIYTNPSFGFFAYSDCYTEIWQYDSYFDASAFSAESMDLGSSADPDGRNDDNNGDGRPDGSSGTNNSEPNGGGDNTSIDNQGADGGGNVDFGGGAGQGSGAEFGDGSSFGGGFDFGGGSDVGGGGGYD